MSRREPERGPEEERRDNDGISQLAETNPGDPQTPPRHLYSLPDIVMVVGFVSDPVPGHLAHIRTLLSQSLNNFIHFLYKIYIHNREWRHNL